jgi:hypothetical protein
VKSSPGLTKRSLSRRYWRSWSERAKVLLRALDRPRLLAVKRFLEAMLEAGENTKGQW